MQGEELLNLNLVLEKPPISLSVKLYGFISTLQD